MNEPLNIRDRCSVCDAGDLEDFTDGRHSQVALIRELDELNMIVQARRLSFAADQHVLDMAKVKL